MNHFWAMFLGAFFGAWIYNMMECWFAYKFKRNNRE